MPDPQRPWYAQGPPQQPVPGNPYASEGGGPRGFGPPIVPTPPTPPPRRRFGRGPVVAAVVALVLVVVAGGAYALSGQWRDEPAKPVAKESPGPSGSAAPSRTPAAGGPEPSHIPTTREVAAARKPAESAAWIADDRTDLPKQINKVHDLWIVGDTAVQALHRKVTAYRLGRRPGGAHGLRRRAARPDVDDRERRREPQARARGPHAVLRPRRALTVPVPTHPRLPCARGAVPGPGRGREAGG